MQGPVLAVVATTWLGVAVAVALLRPRDGALWRALALQLPLMALVLVPAAAGDVAWWGAVAVITAAAAWDAGSLGLAAVVLLGGAALAGLAGDARFGDVVFLYCAVEINDALAWATGKLAGRRRIFGALSPNKTLEGTLGGLLGATLACAALHGLRPGWGPVTAGAAGLALAAAGTAADLALSAVKRRRAVKDFGDWLPVHGSALDVFDALLLTAPLWWLATRC